MTNEVISPVELCLSLGERLPADFEPGEDKLWPPLGRPRRRLVRVPAAAAAVQARRGRGRGRISAVG